MAGEPALPLLIYAAVVLSFPPFRRSVHWARLGRPSRGPRLVTVLGSLISSLALVLWSTTHRPYLQEIAVLLPSGPPWQLALGGLVFATLNPVLEEVIFRGILFDTLESGLGPPLGLIAQAAVFGAFHQAGVPRGLIGACMATVFGLFLGVLRKKSGGLLLCSLAHAAADATIYALVAWSR